MKKLLTIAALSVLFAACTGKTSGSEEQDKPLKDQVMDLHDEVMPLMGDLMKTKKALIKKAQAASDSLELKKLAEDIEVANEAMMSWMRNFDPNFEGTEDEIASYLSEQKESIQDVADKMKSALSEGKKALN